MASRWLRQYTVSQLIRKGWNEIPEVMGSGIFFGIGAVGVLYLAYKEYQIPCNRTKKYKLCYVVHRPDHPFVPYLHQRDSPEAIEEYRRDSQLYTLSPYNK